MKKIFSLIVCYCLMLPLIAGCSNQEKYGHFEKNGELNQPRSSESIVLLKEGKVLITGGSKDPYILNSAEIYNAKTGQFTLIENMHKNRGGNTTTLLKDGKILIVGGLSGDKMPDGAVNYHIEKSAEIYDPKTGKFSFTGFMHNGRYYHTATLLMDGKVLITGGKGQGKDLNSAEIYDPKTRKFTLIENMHKKRAGHSATLLKNGNVLICGGTNFKSTEKSTEIYNYKIGKFYLGSDMSVARRLHSAITLPNNKILIIGGNGDESVLSRIHYNYSSIEIYNPLQNKFTFIKKLNKNRMESKSILLNNGKILVIGGYTISNHLNIIYDKTAEIFEPNTNKLTTIKGLRPPRQGFAMTLLNNGKVLIVGGSNNRGPVKNVDLFEYKK